MKTRRPKAAQQGGTVPTPDDTLCKALGVVGLWKAQANDHFSSIVTLLAQARSDLARVTRERDAALAELAKLKGGGQ